MIPDRDGVWRDGNALVIDLAGHHFPRRCVKSNELVEPPFSLVSLTCHSPGYAELKLLQAEPRRFARTKYVVTSGHKQETRIHFELPLPLTPRWRTIVQSKWGVRLLWIGAAMLMATYAAWVLLHNSFDWEWIPQLSLAVSILVLICGAAVQLHQRSTLTVQKLFDGKIWIGGVHGDWLATLPPFTPSKRMLTEEVRLLSWSFWISASGGLALLLLFLINSLSSGTESAEYRNVRYALLTAAAAALLMGNRARLLLLTERAKLHWFYPVLTRRTFRRQRRRMRKSRRR
ncbi:hypothetical protein [Anatilimnocola floriformis]|uniref:hypothetical protein n=1 Tax=Anatilimnocola floriformis TaxID=2948575 RepID=UPI0020C321B7|nr:hypothetical protein [Anatilimnocola floriformis]